MTKFLIIEYVDMFNLDPFSFFYKSEYLKFVTPKIFVYLVVIIQKIRTFFIKEHKKYQIMYVKLSVYIITDFVLPQNSHTRKEAEEDLVSTNLIGLVWIFSLMYRHL